MVINCEHHFARQNMTRLTLMILMMLYGDLCAADWPQFRGPTGQGIATQKNLPLEWDGQKNVAWKKPMPGGWSSPILYKGRLYLTASASAEDGEQKLRAICMSALDGEIIWNRAVFDQAFNAPQIHKKNSDASPTPFIDGDQLFVHFGHQGTACLDLDGKVLWTNRKLAYKPVHGNGGSPIIVDDKLIFSCDAAKEPFVVALNRKTGKVAWKTMRGIEGKKHFSFSTPLLITVEGRKQVITPGSDAVFAYDPTDGKPIWHVRYKDGYSVVPRPVYGHGLVFVCTGFDRPKLLAIDPTGNGDATNTHVKWETGKGAPHTPSLLLVGDELYSVADRGIVSCLDAKTGEVHWSERVKGQFSASPVYADGKIYLQSENGTGFVLAAEKQFRVLATNVMDERSLASYAIGDAAIYLRTSEHLYRIQR